MKKPKPTCTEHLWGNIAVSYPFNPFWQAPDEREEPKRYTICLNCGVERSVIDEAAPYVVKSIDAFRRMEAVIKKAPTNFHIEENLEVIANANVYNSEKYFE
jgi:hypothetical protein